MQPILQTRNKIANADSVVVIAFTRFVINDGCNKPGSEYAELISNTRHPTIWNQIEAAMAFGLDLPLFLILEKGIHQEAILKDRLEFRALETPLDPAFFRSDEFKGTFADFKRLVASRTKNTEHSKDNNLSTLSIRELLCILRPAQLWGILGATIAVLTAVAKIAFFFGGK